MIHKKHDKNADRVVSEYEVQFNTGTDFDTKLTLLLKSNHSEIKCDEDWLYFNIEPGKHRYLLPDGMNSLSAPPLVNKFPVELGETYQISFCSTLEGGDASVWLIDYDSTQRIAKTSCRLKNAPSSMQWAPHQDSKFLVFALRLSGKGRVKLSQLHFKKVRSIKQNKIGRELAIGPKGNFLRSSVFYDPLDYKNIKTKQSHQKIDNIEEISERFRGFRELLYIGDVTEPLIGALKKVGVDSIEHEFNLPAYLLHSNRYDGIIINEFQNNVSSFSIRSLLRSCKRALSSNGIILIANLGEKNVLGSPIKAELTKNKNRQMILADAGFIDDDPDSEGYIIARVSQTIDSDQGHGGDDSKSSVLTCSGSDSASQIWSIVNETQISCSIDASENMAGGVSFQLYSESVEFEFLLKMDGRCTLNGVELVSKQTNDRVTFCLRLLRPESEGTEYSLAILHGSTIIFDNQELLGLPLKSLKISVDAEFDAKHLEYVDVWSPKMLNIDGWGDALMHMGCCRTGDPLLPDIEQRAFIQKISDTGIGRALIAPFGAARNLDTYDQIVKMTGQFNKLLCPVYQLRIPSGVNQQLVNFHLNQLELLWQNGQLFGVSIDLNGGEIPPKAILDWIERSQVLTLWVLEHPQDIALLEVNILRQYHFPTLLSCLGRVGLSSEYYAKLMDLMTRYQQLYMISSALVSQNHLQNVISFDPFRVLLGSGFPVMAPESAQDLVLSLDIPEWKKTLVMGENLRFLVNRVDFFRQEVMEGSGSLMFPAIPTTPEEVKAQGFEVVDPVTFEDSEFEEAKDYWSHYDIKSWYQQSKPWAHLIADLIAELKPKSVLEFGCNVGRNLMHINEAHPDIKLVGLDINEDAVRIGREHTGLDLRVGDENTLLEFDEGEFDLVFTVSVLDHISDIDQVCKNLSRCSGKYLYLLEVTLPVEGKVVKHLDHKHGGVQTSTGASYSWDVDRFLKHDPRIWRMEKRMTYLHAASLGPYYWAYLAFYD